MITYADIQAAQHRLSGQSRHTPLLSSPFLDEIAGRKIFVKPECLQHTGSFKFRGAWSAVSALPEDQRKNGVIAFSSGNHAQGVALAAARHGIPSVIIMPQNAPALKIANTRALGAEVVLYDRATEAREEIGDRLSAERSLTLIKPYDEPMVIAGQGTVGLEIATDLPGDNAEVLVPCGGGGLTSGISIALAQDVPDMLVRPCEPEGFDDTARSLASGRIEQNATPEGSICDAIVTPAPGDITFPIMKENCGSGIVVTDEECLRAMALAFLRLKIVIEPGGATSLAAALFHGDKLTKDTAVCVASGGNVDPAMFARALQTLES
ncbi:threonine ammonia-lyase [Halocynthiibacter styelae]|uniref:Threonine/serine dehydratase n=1 Tax=Halocynthiibacter styelae TaxID=2761955 RepID=A0A8J7LL99_9RHOB|nr:threonine/serine dehydratase [Paenihalocynthiibacter styelae]MBI1494289.1 threonine/serine dehydratase [Paenihalocynthiibacter styelae]